MILATFILGVAAGIALHRFLMAYVLEESPDTTCAYCKWLNKKKGRHSKCDGLDT